MLGNKKGYDVGKPYTLAPTDHPKLRRQDPVGGMAGSHGRARVSHGMRNELTASCVVRSGLTRKFGHIACLLVAWWKFRLLF